MRQFIGMTSHIGYFSKITNISISNAQKVKIYDITNKCDINVDTSKLNIVWMKELKYEDVITKYDTSNYENGKNNENFKLIVNGECIHSSKYLHTYMIEYDGDFILNESIFVDH